MLKKVSLVSAAPGGSLLVLVLCSALAVAGPNDEKRNEGNRAIRVEHTGGKFLPGADEPVSLFPGHPELENHYSEAAFIRMAYAALEDAIVRSGHFVSFALADFRTYYRRDFGKVQIRELMTLDSPFRLEVRQTEVADADGSAVGLAYTPRWVRRFTIEDVEEMKEFMDHYRDFTIADGIRHPEAKEEQRRMIAVTSYEVTAKHEGESHTYRAAFKWLPGPPGEATFQVEDHVTDGVDRALITDGQVAPLKILLGRSLEDGSPKKERER